MNIRIRAWMLIMLGIPGISVGRPVETGFLNRSVSIEGTMHRYQVYVPATYRQSVIDWFEFRPKIDYRPITGGSFAPHWTAARSSTRKRPA